MSRRRRKTRHTSGAAQVRKKPLQRGKKLSRFLREAERCLPIDAAFAAVHHDVLWAEGGHLLTRQMGTRLLVTKGILQGLERGSHFFGDDIRIPMRILYNELSEPIRAQLAERGIPVEEEQPFLFDYGLLGAYLPRGVRLDKFYEAFMELMLDEWKANYAHKLFVGFGFDEWAREETLTTSSRQKLRTMIASEAPDSAKSGFTLRTARGLWFASEYIIRIRAQWDRLLKQFVLERVLGNERAQALSFEAACESIQGKRESFVTESQRECLDALLRLASQTKNLRDWRDNEVHFFSQSVFGVIERKKTNESLATLWGMVIDEHNRAREGIVAAMGMVVLGPPSSLVYYTGKWPAPRRYIDFDSPDDASKHSALVLAIREQARLKGEIQKATSQAEKAKSQERILKIAVQAHRLVCELFGMADEERRPEGTA